MISLKGKSPTNKPSFTTIGYPKIKKKTNFRRSIVKDNETTLVEENLAAYVNFHTQYTKQLDEIIGLNVVDRPST